MSPGEKIFHTKLFHPQDGFKRHRVGLLSIFLGIVFLLTITISWYDSLIRGEEVGLKSKWHIYILPGMVAMPLFWGLFLVLSVETRNEITVYMDRVVLKGGYASLGIDKPSNPSSLLSRVAATMSRKEYSLLFKDILVVVPNYQYNCSSPMMINFFEIKMRSGDRYTVLFWNSENPIPHLRLFVNVVNVEKGNWDGIRQHLLEDHQHIPNHAFLLFVAKKMMSVEYNAKSWTFFKQYFGAMVVLGTLLFLLNWVDLVAFLISYTIWFSVGFLGNTDCIYHERFGSGLSIDMVMKIVEVERFTRTILIPSEYLDENKELRPVVDGVRDQYEAFAENRVSPELWRHLLR